VETRWNESFAQPTRQYNDFGFGVARGEQIAVRPV
jgi:hypothetical protein